MIWLLILSHRNKMVYRNIQIDFLDETGKRKLYTSVQRNWKTI